MINGRPVCDDGFTLTNAHVACRQLGYRGAVSFTKESRYGNTGSNFAMDDIRCNGRESRLLDCQHKEYDDCEGTEAAGAVCNTSKTPYESNDTSLYDYTVNYDEDYYEYSEEPQDNCSLATSLYYPLRRSETHYKSFRNMVMRDSNRDADYMMRRIDTYPDRDFRFRPSGIIRQPSEEAEFNHKDTIATISTYYLIYGCLPFLHILGRLSSRVQRKELQV